MSALSLTVVVVSDYERRGAKTWEYERRILTALSQQDLQDPFDVSLVLNGELRKVVPDSLAGLVPNLTILFLDNATSSQLKDHGVRHAITQYVAVLEADCVPCREWLRVLLDVIRSRDDISIVSGRTNYGEGTMFRRALNLLDRAWDDLGESGLTMHVSNNGAIYRRSVLERYPYPAAITPFFSAGDRNRRMVAAGHQFFFERSAVMEHAIGGWDFVRDFRRHSGYAAMMLYGNPRYATLPIVTYKRIAREIKDCIRLGRKYLRWYDWPLTILLLQLLPFLELPGMVDAIRGRDVIPKTSYR